MPVTIIAKTSTALNRPARAPALVIRHPRQSLGQERILRGHGCIDEPADGAHGGHTAIGARRFASSIRALGYAGLQRALERREPVVDLQLEVGHPPLLLGIVAGELAQPGQQRPRVARTRAIGFEIRRIARDEVAALTALRVLDRALELLRGLDHLDGVSEHLAALREPRSASDDLVGLQADQRPPDPKRPRKSARTHHFLRRTGIVHVPARRADWWCGTFSRRFSHKESCTRAKQRDPRYDV